MAGRRVPEDVSIVGFDGITGRRDGDNGRCVLRGEGFELPLQAGDIDRPFRSGSHARGRKPCGGEQRDNKQRDGQPATVTRKQPASHSHPDTKAPTGPC